METTLHDAVQSKDIEIVRRMILAGGDVNSVNVAGHTLLHLATTVPMAELLVKAGADLEAHSHKGDTPLRTASVVAPPEVVSYLVAAGADVPARNPKTGFSVLHYLAWSEGREELAALMIAAGAEVNARNKNLRTPLHLAASNRVVPLTGLLLEKGGDPDAVDEDGATPLMLALLLSGVMKPNLPLLDLYFESGFDPNAHGPTGLTALHLASARNRMAPVVKRLIELGANIEAGAELPGYGVSGFRPLHAAAWLGMEQTLTVLAEGGADIEAHTSDGRSALHWAASPLREGLQQTVFIVREMTGVTDTNQLRLEIGPPPIPPYLRKDGLPAIKALLAHGAAPGSRDKSDRTPLEVARETGYEDTVAYLRDLETP